MKASHPVMSEVPGCAGGVRFLKRRAVEALQAPWPRCQDLPAQSFGVPRGEDFVVAVSHAWGYQAHPDPLGHKIEPLQKLLEQAEAVHEPKGATLVFADFISTPQRPFARGQRPRCPDEDEAFARAMGALPMIFLSADATLHLDVPLAEEADDMEEVEVPLDEFDGVPLQAIGCALQVFDFRAGVSSLLDPFDVVVEVGKRRVSAAEGLELLRSSTARQQSGWASCCTERQVVRVKRAPFGQRNISSANVRGWIFLERFASMVKAAMVHESQATRVAFSNSQAVLDEIFEGARRLRDAARGGRNRLHAAFEHFAWVLDEKRFTATSLDKQLGAAAPGAARGGAASGPGGDRRLALDLMRELLRCLEQRWLPAEPPRQLLCLGSCLACERPCRAAPPGRPAELPAPARKEQRGLSPERLRAEAPEVGEAAAAPGPPAVRRATEEHAAAGRRLAVPVWECEGGGRAEVHVLFLALQWRLPWAAQERAAELLAERLCPELAAKLWVLNCEVLDQQLLTQVEPLPKLHAQLVETIQALPLHEKFVIVDSSGGWLTPVLWRLAGRLAGALVLNAGAFLGEELDASPKHEVLSNVFAWPSGMAAQRDIARQLEELPRWAFAVSVEERRAQLARYRAALQSAPASFWRWYRYVSSDLRAAARVYRSLPELPLERLVLAVSALGPAALTHEPATRLQQLAPGASFVHIPESKVLWELEGDGPVLRVASALRGLLSTHRPRETCSL